jgi:hypothetical protein
MLPALVLASNLTGALRSTDPCGASFFYRVIEGSRCTSVRGTTLTCDNGEFTCEITVYSITDIDFDCRSGSEACSFRTDYAWVYDRSGACSGSCGLSGGVIAAIVVPVLALAGAGAGIAAYCYCRAKSGAGAAPDTPLITQDGPPPYPQYYPPPFPAAGVEKMSMPAYPPPPPPPGPGGPPPYPGPGPAAGQAGPLLYPQSYNEKYG